MGNITNPADTLQQRGAGRCHHRVLAGRVTVRPLNVIHRSPNWLSCAFYVKWLSFSPATINLIDGVPLEGLFYWQVLSSLQRPPGAMLE